MRRGLVLICLALLAAGCGTQAGASHRGDAPQPGTTLQGNRLAARRDARTLLARLQLPADVKRVAKPPSYAGPVEGGGASNRQYSAGDHAWWTTAASPQAIIAYVKTHRPPGAKIVSTGSGFGPNGTSLEVMFGWPALGLQAFNRTLTVSVISRLPGSQGPAAVLARSQSYWMFPRPRSERVPRGVHAVTVTLRIGAGPQGLRHPRTGTHVITGSSRVRTIVGALDSLPIVQPGVVYSCPAVIEGIENPRLTLYFRAGPAGPALARAQVDVTPGKHGASGWDECDPIDFWIGSRAQKPLTSQTFVRRIGRLIGADIS